MLTRKIESESWAEANAQTKIDNQSIEVARGAKQTRTCPSLITSNGVAESQQAKNFPLNPIGIGILHEIHTDYVDQAKHERNTNFFGYWHKSLDLEFKFKLSLNLTLLS